MKVTVRKALKPAAAIAFADKGVAVPLPAAFEVHDPVLAGVIVTGSLGADPNDNTVTVDEIRLHRQPDGPSITAQHLRLVSIPRILDAAIAQLGVPWDATSNRIDLDAYAALTAPDVASLRGKRGDPTPPEALQAVADVYNAAESRPTMRVAKQFGWPRSTASRRIREARDAGLIREPTQ